MIESSLFAQLIPLKMLTPERSRELVADAKRIRLSPGESLIREGEVMTSIDYLLQGRLALVEASGQRRIVQGGSKLARLPLEQAPHARVTATALDEAVCLRIDREALETQLALDQATGFEVHDLVAEDAGTGEDDWMARLLQTKLFQRIPPTSIQAVFQRMQTLHFQAGDAVVRQGEAGDLFYILREGRCRVVRRTRKNPEGLLLATLRAGDTFGEEALISGRPRNATVLMETDGVLIGLGKSDFLELLNEPLLTWGDYAQASALAAQGGIWLDVRLPQEHAGERLPQSVNIPLPLLRHKLGRLDRNVTYLVYCDNGRRSAVAAYLMAQNDFRTLLLQGGLKSVPAEQRVRGGEN